MYTKRYPDTVLAHFGTISIFKTGTTMETYAKSKKHEKVLKITARKSITQLIK